MASAPQPMDIALDDYMKEKNIRRPKRGGTTTDAAGTSAKTGRGRGGARRGRSARGGAGAGGQTTRSPATKRPAASKPQSKVSGRRTISKAGGGGGRTGSARGRNLNSNLRGAMGTRWQHDLFSSPTSGGGGGGSGSGSSRSTSAKALITNLDFGVTDNDIRDLFSEFGTILKHAVHYDKSGRSMGIAEVTFSSRSDALRAKAKYNNVPLDGRPMQIAVEGSPASGGGAAGDAEPGSMKSRIGQRPPRPSGTRASPRGGARSGSGAARAGKRTSGGAAAGRGTGRGGKSTASRGRGGRGGGGSPRGGGRRGGRDANLTSEQLDADLDAYKNQNGA